MENKERLYGRRAGEIGLKQETILSFFQPVPDHGIEHISGREELKGILRNLCEECTAEKISVPDGILLCGERGTGKTYIAQAFAGDMMKKGYRFMRVYPVDIWSAWVGVTEMILAAVFEEAAEHAPCVLLFENIEYICRERTDPSVMGYAKNMSAAFLENYARILERNRSGEKPVLVLGITDDPERLDQALREHMNPIRLGLPDAEARGDFFRQMFGENIVFEDIACEEMGARTEGCNYHTLFRIFEKMTASLRDVYMNSPAEELRLTADMFERALTKR